LKEALKISIVTISYNAERHIEKTIQSVIDQNYPNLEYIVIDGGSSDKTVDIIEKYSEHIAYWVSEKDNGISDAFNKGIQKATGDLIGLLNADDFYLLNTLNQLAMEYDQSSVVYGKMRTIVNGVNKGDYLPDHLKLEEDMSLCHPSTFIRKDLYDQFGAYDEDFSLAMDYELLLRMYKCGASFQYIDKTFTAMNMEGVSNLRWKDAFREVIKAQDIHLGTSGKRHLQNKFKLARKSLAAVMNSTGLSFVVESYRRNFSKIKKESNG